MAHHFIAKLDFSKKVLNALARKGIFVVSAFCSNPLSGEVAYQLSDGRVRSLLDVIAIAEA